MSEPEVFLFARGALVGRSGKGENYVATDWRPLGRRKAGRSQELCHRRQVLLTGELAASAPTGQRARPDATATIPNRPISDR